MSRNILVAIGNLADVEVELMRRKLQDDLLGEEPEVIRLKDFTPFAVQNDNFVAQHGSAPLKFLADPTECYTEMIMRAYGIDASRIAYTAAEARHNCSGCADHSCPEDATCQAFSFANADGFYWTWTERGQICFRDIHYQTFTLVDDGQPLPAR